MTRSSTRHRSADRLLVAPPPHDRDRRKTTPQTADRHGSTGLLQDWWWALVWLLTAPVAGELVQGTETVRFARTLEALLRNGLPLLAALKLTEGVQRNRRVSAAIAAAMNTVRSGGRLAPALAAEHVLPSLAVELMTIGEESGQLESMLGKAAETFRNAARAKVETAADAARAGADPGSRHRDRARDRVDLDGNVGTQRAGGVIRSSTRERQRIDGSSC